MYGSPPLSVCPAWALTAISIARSSVLTNTLGNRHGTKPILSATVPTRTFRVTFDAAPGGDARKTAISVDNVVHAVVFVRRLTDRLPPEEEGWIVFVQRMSVRADLESYVRPTGEPLINSENHLRRVPMT